VIEMRRILLCYTEPPGRIQVYKFVGNAYDLLMDIFRLSDYGGKIFASAWVLREEDYKKMLLPLILRDRELLEDLITDGLLDQYHRLKTVFRSMKLLGVQVWNDEDIEDIIKLNVKRLRRIHEDMEPTEKEFVTIGRLVMLGEEIWESLEKNPRSVIGFDVFFLGYEPICKDILFIYLERERRATEKIGENIFPDLLFFRDKITFSILLRLLAPDILEKTAAIIREINIDRLKYIDSEENLLKLFCKHFGEVI
jgi:hypothetical protein